MGIIMAAIFFGGSVETFLSIPSFLIVLGGTILVVLIKFNLSQALGAANVARRAFVSQLAEPEELIDQIIEMNSIARREGILALEDHEVDDPFLKRGVGLLVDGCEPETIKSTLGKDMRETSNRHKLGAKVFTALGDVAPAMGMIGTLIGLVQMLSSMDDPKKIGPAMAIALLTTLYGAILGNVIALPIADKLTLRRNEEAKLNAICLDGLLGMCEGQNPRVLESMLKTYLSPKERDQPKGDDDKPALKSVA